MTRMSEYDRITKHGPVCLCLPPGPHHPNCPFAAVCPKCSGRVIFDGAERSCLNCGWIDQPEPLDIPLRHEFGDPVMTNTERSKASQRRARERYEAERD